MREPLKKIATRKVTHEGIEVITRTTEDLANALNAAIDRINELEDYSNQAHERISELEAKYEGHRHEYTDYSSDDGDGSYLELETTTPVEPAQGGEGR